VLNLSIWIWSEVSVSQPEQPLENTHSSETTNPPGNSSTEENSMGEYYQLKKTLLVLTLILTGVIFSGVWWNYSPNIALNYLLGSGVGLLYLRRLAKDVEGLSNENPNIGKNRLILFIGLIIIAAKWQQLEILPIFLGFVTYKVAIIIYMMQSSFMSSSK
jgi:ATP synthase protein I